MSHKFIDSVEYDFDIDITPKLIVNENEKIVFKTLDCFSNKLIPEGSRMGIDTLNQSNPITGPVYLVGAEPQTSIVVSIEKIELGPIAISYISDNYSALKNKNIVPQIKRVKIIDNASCELLNKVVLPIKPSIGTIGVVPVERIGSCYAGDHGGNIDCFQMNENSKIILPVFHEGALLSMGDLHASIGDGELAECGLEVEGKVTVNMKVLKNFYIGTPVIVNKESISIVSTGSSIEKAIEVGLDKMLDIIVASFSVTAEEGVHILNLFTNVRLCQLNDYQKVIRIECGLKRVMDYINNLLINDLY